MSTMLATYFTWAEFNGDCTSTLEEFRNYLSRYSCSKVVYLCGALGQLLNNWEGPELRLEAHSELLALAFPPELSRRLIESSRNPEHARFVFHRVQLLLVVKEAILNCDETGIDPLTTPYWGGLGTAFLMANDHVHFASPSGMDPVGEIVEYLPNFVLLQEYAGHNRFAYRVVRAQLMYTRFLEQLKGHADYVDIAAEFGKFGLSLTEFESLCFVVLAKYFKLDLDRFKSHSEEFLLNRSYFQSAAIIAEKIDLFLQEISDTHDGLRAALTHRNTGPIDFTAFRDRPIYQQDNNLYPIDPAFVAEKPETGPFWKVLGSLGTDQEKQRLHRFWGILFQEYLNWLLASSADRSANVYVPSPRYARTQEEVCDGIVLCGSTALFLEFKSATFTAKAKYSGDPAALMSELESKLVSPKGAAQLASAIHQLFDKGSEITIDKIETSKIHKVFPVLVTRDDITDAFFMNHILNGKFRAMINRKKIRSSVVITPLFCLTADEVEYISPYLSDTPFCDILEAKYRADRDLKVPFYFSENAVLKQKGQRRSEVLHEQYREISNRFKDVLFPGAPNLP